MGKKTFKELINYVPISQYSSILEFEHLLNLQLKLKNIQ